MINRMKELKNILNNASNHYYNGTSIMTDKEWDLLYDEYEKLEKESGIILSNSPTQNVGFEVISKLEKIRHDSKMLSLEKTKDISALSEFIQNNKALLSFKLDGLTVVISYNNGTLLSAVTRGNGEIGEDITHNAKYFSNIPLTIPYNKKLTIRGEAIISYSEFERINNEIINVDDKYKNPRNLCSGTVRQLDNEICKNRNVKFIAFKVIENENFKNDSEQEHLMFLNKLGFEVVEHAIVDKDNIALQVENFKNKINNYDYPSDGLVLTFDSISYGEKLGIRSKSPRNSIAFKWQDEAVESTLIDIEWNPSRTGLINPIAIFEPVEIEGTIVEKASVHNVSIVKELELGIGDTLQVIKANMIIPQILDNETRSSNCIIPTECPCCNGKTEIIKNDTCEVLICTNPDCSAKLVGKIVHFCSRDAMNIEGLSEATAERFVEKGLLKNLSDIYKLHEHKNIITRMEGFGIRSYNKLIEAIEKSKKCYMNNFLYGLGINQIGRTASKNISKNFDYDWFKFEESLSESFDFRVLEDFGDKANESIYNWYSNVSKDICAGYHDMCRLSIIMDFQKPDININKSNNDKIKGLTFVITGEVEHYKNRKELQEEIEKLGGKVSGSVSAKTNYLINNDVTSTTGKNQNANKLGVKIISEKEFLKMIE